MIVTCVAGNSCINWEHPAISGETLVRHADLDVKTGCSLCCKSPADDDTGVMV